MIAAVSAIGGATVAASATVIVALYQRLSQLRSEHQLRAFEQHLADYERIFVTARSVQDALHDYIAIESKVVDRSDPFLRQILSILSTAAHDFNTAVDWRHNPAMVYLDVRSENLCLHARTLLISWLSVQRISTGDVAFVRRGNDVRRILASEVRGLTVGAYDELIVESRRTVESHPSDRRLGAQIDKALTRVILDLKKILAY
ncbi:hypothetical protein [Kribbella kalugense]|uniref:hypothetical protein n=1 Tax=Kribbella kalugense TaxID=2512221 RepID=UPI001064DC1C|nr:hypothetical protein [Kribbella kalugense]